MWARHSGYIINKIDFIFSFSEAFYILPRTDRHKHNEKLNTNFIKTIIIYQTDKQKEKENKEQRGWQRAAGWSRGVNTRPHIVEDLCTFQGLVLKDIVASVLIS